MRKSNIDKIREFHEEYPQLCHASNILNKYEVEEKIPQLTKIAEKYIVYLTENLKMVGFSDAIIKKRVHLLNDYYNFIHDNGYDRLYTSQGKFRPTILEEFLFLLFRGICLRYGAASALR